MDLAMTVTTMTQSLQSLMLQSKQGIKQKFVKQLNPKVQVATVVGNMSTCVSNHVCWKHVQRHAATVVSMTVQQSSQLHASQQAVQSIAYIDASRSGAGGAYGRHICLCPVKEAFMGHLLRPCLPCRGVPVQPVLLSHASLCSRIKFSGAAQHRNVGLGLVQKTGLSLTMQLTCGHGLCSLHVVGWQLLCWVAVATTVQGWHVRHGFVKEARLLSVLLLLQQTSSVAKCHALSLVQTTVK